MLEGAVTSVNGKTGAVTLAAADGALPTAGGIRDLNVHGDLGIKGKNIAALRWIRDYPRRMDILQALKWDL